MTRSLPPLDAHAHVRPDVDASELEALGAVIFAVTRSHLETVQALERTDRATVWGAGVHPGLVGAQKAFSKQSFNEFIQQTPFVGEVGLDAKSRVDKHMQSQTLQVVLAETAAHPRIVSIHSFGAADAVLNLLEKYPQRGAVLHWWLGDAQQTIRAIEMGCYFSVNPSSVRDVDLLAQIPLSRLLTETDHPAGDRFSGSRSHPGYVAPVERAIGQLHRLSSMDARAEVWRNFSELVAKTSTESAMPSLVQRILRHVRLSNT